AREPEQREAAALTVADRDHARRPEERGGACGIGGPHLAPEAEVALAPDGKERDVQVREARRHVDQLGEVARVARDVRSEERRVGKERHIRWWRVVEDQK